jgi:geranylgeranyl pyrophosphate synthase
LLKNSGSFEKARVKMFELVDNSWKEVEKYLPDNVYRVYLKELAEYGIKRNK